MIFFYKMGVDGCQGWWKVIRWGVMVGDDHIDSRLLCVGERVMGTDAGITSDEQVDAFAEEGL